MKVEIIAESPWSILKYFWPALSKNWSWKLIFAYLRVAVLDRVYCVSTHALIGAYIIFWIPYIV